MILIQLLLRHQNKESRVKFKLLSTAVAAGLLGLSGTASAYMAYFGEDLNHSASVALTATPNSSAQEAAFKALLSGVGTENFEGQTVGASTPLALSFPGTGSTTVTATLSGGGGTVAAVTSGSTNGAGRYSVPSSGSTRYWEVNAGTTSGNFEITFSEAIAAFGFYGVDIGDFGGRVSLEFFNGATSVGTQAVAHTVGSGGSTDGSVLFFGAIASGAAEEFTSVKFSTTYGSGDIFAFDNFTIGTRAQVIDPDPSPTPIPGTLLLAGLGLAGLGAMRRRVR